MKPFIRALVVLIIATAAQAQIKPNCDVDCTPTPPSSGGDTTTTPPSVTSLGSQSAERGYGNVRSAAVKTGGAVTVQGSQSYTYSVPMFAVPGRAGFDLNLTLYYNSRIWSAGGSGAILGLDRDTPTPGFRLNFGFLEWNPASPDPAGIITTPDGAKHALTEIASNLVLDPSTDLYRCANNICQYVSNDSSYYFVYRPLGTKGGVTCLGPDLCPAPDVTVLDKDGRTYLYESFALNTNDTADEFVMRPYKITDRNGNFITITYEDTESLNISTITDTLGRVLYFVYDTNGLLQCVNETGASCTTQSGPIGIFPFGPGKEYTFNWDPAHSIVFNFPAAQALIGDKLYNITSPFTLPMLTSICRPDTSCVKFNYGDWGIVNDIQELSADGTTVRYEVSYDFPAASAGQLTTNPTYAHQTEKINGKTLIWNTSVTTDSTTGLMVSSTITDPRGLSTTTFFSHNGPPDWHDGLPTQIQMIDQGELNAACPPTLPCPNPPPPLLTRNLTWTSDPSPGSTDPTFQSVNRINPRPATVVTVLENGSQKQFSMSYDSTSGQVTDLQETDFGTSAPGPLLRETITAYKSLSSHVLGLPTDIQVKDGTGKVVSHSAMGYDETATLSVPTSATGHDDLDYPSGSNSTRGNLTTATKYPNPTSTAGAISTTYTYDMLGNRVAQSCCPNTSFNFSSTTDYAYPDSVIQDPGGAKLTTSFTYTARGQVFTQTDWNNQVTQFGYDTEGRSTSVKTPDNVTVTTQYDDRAENPAIQTSSSANSSVTVHTLDFLGNPVSDQLMNGSTLLSTTTYDDDFLGTLKVSNPFAPGETPGYTVYNYDLFQRTTSVTPPPATAGGHQQPYSISFSGNTKTVTDPAGQSQRQFVNGIGQVTELDLPGPTGGAPASGSLTVPGNELSVPSTSASNGATAGTASVSIGGTLDRTTTVVTQTATPTKITVTIGGGDGTNTTTSTLCTGGPPSRLPLTCRTTTTNIPDSGNMQYSVNVAGTVITSAQVPYNNSSTQAGLAQSLAGALPANSLVTVAYLGGSSFTVTTTATGSATSTTSVAMSIVSSCVDSSSDASSTVCNQGWTAGQSTVAGVDQKTAPNSDMGTVTVSITANGTTYTKKSNYSSTSSPSSIASDLYNQFNGDTAFSQVARVTPPGTSGVPSNVIAFTTVATGSGTSYPISASSATTDSNFAPGSTSFPVTAPAAFSPGANGTLYDTGTVTLALNGFTSGVAPSKQVTYGQGSNAQGIAAQLVSLINSDLSFPVSASVPQGSATISFTARTQGVAGNSYAVKVTGASNVSSSFPTPSFASPAVSVTLANGVEPTYSLDNGAAIVTRYTNDPRGMVLQAIKGQQTQTYAYDGLGRLTSVITPETSPNAVQYTYTNFNAIQDRIDPRVLPATSTPVKTTYSYDTLDRVTGITYNDGTPNVTYTYDPPLSPNNTGGRLDNVSNSVEKKAYQYDLMGRISQCTETIGTSVYTVGYHYAPDGKLSSITYPSQKIINYSYDPVDRLQGVVLGTTQSIVSINPADYNAAGMPRKVTYGNGMIGQYGYNGQLQLSSIQYGAAPPAAPVFSLTYLYGDPLNNGQIQGITDNVVPERSTSYKYDPLGQLVSAQTTDLTKANTWKLGFNYDIYGNRLHQVPQGGTSTMPANDLIVNPATNRIQTLGVLYDNAGNMVSDGVSNYTYDAENHITAVSPVSGMPGSPASFSYGPDGARVNNNGTIMIYAAGKAIAEYTNGAAAGSPSIEYINVSGNQVAAIAAGGAITFNYADHLSIRLAADQTGKVTRSSGHFPFGETWYQTGTSSKWVFTSYERDLNSSGLDYANARFYSSRFGRFTAVDQVLGSNRYAYVGNDPINMIDPTGMDASCTLNPFDTRILPICGPDQLGNAVGASCAPSFGSDDFGFSFTTSGCGSFSFDISGFGGLPFGNLGDTIHNLLAEFVNIDTCPAGTFECPSDGSPLFGTPTCDPRFCLEDTQSTSSSSQQDCLNAYNNSAAGKAVQFLSLYHAFTNLREGFKEWVVLPGLKVAAGNAAKAISKRFGNLEIWSITSGASAPAEEVLAPTAAGIETLEVVGGRLAPPAIVAATYADAQMHATCAGYDLVPYW